MRNEDEDWAPILQGFHEIEVDVNMTGDCDISNGIPHWRGEVHAKQNGEWRDVIFHLLDSISMLSKKTP